MPDKTFKNVNAESIVIVLNKEKKGELTEQWAPRGLPTTFFIDPRGNRRYLALGGRPWDRSDYLDFINRLLREKQNQ